MLTAFFSPTGTTRKIAMNLTEHLNKLIKHHMEIKTIDFTRLSEREVENDTTDIQIGHDELFIMALPVYAGRIPNVLLPTLKRFKGDKTKTVIVVVYGNRNYDDALMELWQLLNANGFDIIAAGAFIGEHSFSNTLAAGRPDDNDLLRCNQFAQQIAHKLALFDSKYDDSESLKISLNPKIPGNWPLGPYYRPVDADGIAFDFKRILPITLPTCVSCGLCAILCPMQSISHVDYRTIEGLCIKCCACIKQCPVDAKEFIDPNFIKHKRELEINFTNRREPECFL